MKLVYFTLPVLAALAGPALAQELSFGEEDVVALDTDGDGDISQSEFAAFTDFAFNQIDADGNGYLSTDEVAVYLAGDAFRILDEDGNGTISSSEFSAEMNENFGAADRDGDGELN